jgi:hypothetical protein
MTIHAGFASRKSKKIFITYSKSMVYTGFFLFCIE